MLEFNHCPTLPSAMTKERPTCYQGILPGLQGDVLGTDGQSPSLKEAIGKVVGLPADIFDPERGLVDPKVDFGTRSYVVVKTETHSHWRRALMKEGSTAEPIPIIPLLDSPEEITKHVNLVRLGQLRQENMVALFPDQAGTKKSARRIQRSISMLASKTDRLEDVYSFNLGTMIVNPQEAVCRLGVLAFVMGNYDSARFFRIIWRQSATGLQIQIAQRRGAIEADQVKNLLLLFLGENPPIKIRSFQKQYDLARRILLKSLSFTVSQ